MRLASPFSEIESFGSEFGTESTRRSTRRRRAAGESRRRKRTRPRVVVLRNLRKEMPSVEMRRTTRVFGMGKGVDGARVLRSGRRLWPESSVVKLERTSEDEDWFKLIKNNGEGRDSDAIGLKHKGWTRATRLAGHKPKPNIVVSVSRVLEKPVETKVLADGLKQYKRFGIVYTRKRRRTGHSVNVENQSGSEDRMYGQRFARKRRKTSGSGSLVEAERLDLASPEVLHITFESSWGRRNWAARLLYSIFVYMSRSSLQLTELSQFLVSEPLSIVFALPGINFSWVRSSTVGSGVCKFFGSKEFMPMFSVDFSAVPQCFTLMHSEMHFRYIFRPILPVNYLNDGPVDDDDVNQCGNDSDECVVLHEVDHAENRPLHPVVKVPKLGCRSTVYRNGLSSRGSIQKRRSSLRRRRSRNPSFVALRRPNGALVSELMNIKKNGLSFSSVASNQKLRRSDSTCSATNSKAVSSNADRLVQDLHSTCCTANLLVSESDRCYREVGVTIMLETSSSGEWLLVVKKDGLTRLTHKAEKEKVIRPGSNRFTHDIIWSPDSDILRLEFPDRSEWITFKELYKECSDRNATIEFIPEPASDRNATAKSIPVPGVREVPGYADSHSSPFLIPESYISVKEDEVSRSFAKKTANYDMDSEDEEWLKKFNVDFEDHEHVSEDKFELMVDAFEKAFYSKPYDFSDGIAAASHFLDMGKRDVVEAVYSYWMNKRKQKKSSLLRVFQGHQVKRPLLDSKPVMRKRRSFKRQPSQFGRGKQPSFLQALAAEQDALQEQNAVLKVEEAKAAADRSVDLAIRKRQRAQVLMQNADLATYKAAMAYRIAEAAQVLGSPDAAAVYVLD
ncbi:uncharacterized protein LOC133714036 [Rosa rugosa]|uniref:uncharacterized protein LOC133714036 n=1 Tax=Rosa rugosa TaxID=74645 RepID=UPI002B402FB4|nr:uncharacterized protein LOC133714036 [Rosa rugosa]